MNWILIFIVGFVIGDAVGLIAACICSGRLDDMEEKRRINKNIRQRCNTDGSEKGAHTNEILPKV